MPTRLLAAGCVWVLVTLAAMASGRQEARMAPQRPPLYDSRPDHLWNRIHERFHLRAARDGSRYGWDTLDPLLWYETRYLLTEPSHSAAVRLLDEFLSSGGERLVADPVRRAVFQNDLWAVFDWLATGSNADMAPRRALIQRVARVMRRVALPRKSIEALPDNYAAAVAAGAFAGAAAAPSIVDPPIDLFSPAGPWVPIGGTSPLAPQHTGEQGRSAFIVMWNVPGGAPAARAYFEKLWTFPEPFVADRIASGDGELRATTNPALPAIPDGTRIALVRKMLLVDDTGVIVPSNIVQSIQLRAPLVPAFGEVKMSRAALFAGKAGGLRAVGARDSEFLTFSAKGMDPFEQKTWHDPAKFRPLLETCATCHDTKFQPATASVLSLRGLLKPRVLVDSSHERWSRWFTQPAVAAEAKSRTYEWGLLQGMWETLPR